MANLIQQYAPLYKPNQLICGTGNVAILAGWTVKGSVAKHLTPDEYAVIGQLYSPTRGISFLLRNLLVNPQVNAVVALAATKEDRNAGACQCLADFFKNGFRVGLSDTGKRCWVINSPVTGYIDREVSGAALEELRRSIELREATSIKDAVAQARELAGAPPTLTRQPAVFPLEEPQPTILPGPRYGHRVEGRTIAEAWVKIIQRIKTTGAIRPTGYDGQWQELIDLVTVVTDEPEGFYFPEPNYLPVSPEFAREYVAQILESPPPQEGVKYTYGQRLRSWFGVNQIEQVITKLADDPDAASAVMSLWDTDDHNHGGSPCLNHVWTRIVQGELSLTATFRSNDMFSAWPANAMGLRALQRHIRDKIAESSGDQLCLKLGPLITISQSAHIYDDCWENADRLIADQYTAICQRQSYDDPCGNFLIEVDQEAIIVTRTTPGSGEEVKRYSAVQPLRLIREICADSPALQPAHAGYLGIELQKAQACIKSGQAYVQDKACRP